MGGDKKPKYQIELPDGKQHNLHNGDRGFFVRDVYALRVLEGFRYRFRGIRLTEKLEVGKRGMNSFPAGKDVSKHHTTVACVNNYYFMKDAGSRKGTYFKLASSGKNKRVELHKGMTFAVGKVHLKVANIEGDAADNQEAKAAAAAAAKEKEAAAAEKSGKKEDLDSDEEYADDSDDGGGGGGGKKTKLEGPPVLFLASVDKRQQIRGRIRETSTIGAAKDSNKVQIKEEIAKEKAVSDVNTRIILEDGHFYLEDAGSKFGTFIGFPKKKLVQVTGGDQMMLGTARCQIEHYPGKMQFIDGLIDKIMGNMGTNVHDVKVLSTSSSYEERLQVALGSAKPKKSKATDGNGSD